MPCDLKHEVRSANSFPFSAVLGQLTLSFSLPLSLFALLSIFCNGMCQIMVCMRVCVCVGGVCDIMCLCVCNSL